MLANQNQGKFSSEHVDKSRLKMNTDEINWFNDFYPGKSVILPPLLNRAHKVMIYGRVGQPSHRAIYLALIYSQKSITIKEN